MRHRPLPSPVDVLLVEDNPADIRLMQEVLRDSNLPANLSVARDGVEAMAFLHRAGRYGQAVHPHLVLLDLNLPGKDGREVLAEVKRDPGLRHIPVVVLTTSAAEQDVVYCYDLHANCYVIKPVDLGRFITVMNSMLEFWFTIVKLPPM